MVEFDLDVFYDVLAKVLSWALIFGLSASVDFELFRQRFREKAIYIGIFCQFFIFPLVGFLSVIAYNLEQTFATVLIILVSSPGGSYSNFWCSMSNADLALSVAMTTVSTMASLFMLPLNLTIYVNTLYPMVKSMPSCNISALPSNMSAVSSCPSAAKADWMNLGITLAIVISAVLVGLAFGYAFPKQQSMANFLGQVMGIASIVLSVTASSDSETKPWEQPVGVILACLTPLVAGLCAAVLFTALFRLKGPQKLAIGVETAYQSVTIALLYALSLKTPEGREAAGLTVIYGAGEVLVFSVFCFVAWRLGWTYSPKEYGLRELPKILMFNYQPKICFQESCQTMVDATENSDLCKVHRNSDNVSRRASLRESLMSWSSKRGSNRVDVAEQIPIPNTDDPSKREDTVAKS